MTSLDKAEKEISVGRFQRALRHLTGSKAFQLPQEALAHNIAKADALQLTGNNGKAEQYARAGLRSPARSPATDARCLDVLALVAFESGQLKKSLNLFQKARAAAESAHDLAQVCRILLDIVANLADSLSSDTAAAKLNECKTLVARIGHTHLETRLHLVAAELEGKRGLLDAARSHLRAAEWTSQGSLDTLQARRIVGFELLR